MENNTNRVDVTSLLLQALSLQILFRDYNNVDLMNELKIQDEKYFKTIIQQNNEIIQQNKEIINFLMEGGKLWKMKK